MIIAFLSLLYSIGCSEEARPARSGAQVFAGACSSCHQRSGEGSGRLYPPLAGSEWVLGDPDTLIRIVIRSSAQTAELTSSSSVYRSELPTPEVPFPYSEP